MSLDEQCMKKTGHPSCNVNILYSDLIYFEYSIRNLPRLTKDLRFGPILATEVKCLADNMGPIFAPMLASILVQGLINSYFPLGYLENIIS